MGTQIAAVFTPYTILKKELRKQDIRLDKIVLMATSWSRPFANRFKAVLEARNDKTTVEIREISSGTVHDGALPPAQDVFEQYRDDLVVFNLAGGMNFQVALCALAAVKGNMSGLFLYPEIGTTFVSKIENGRFITGNVPSQQHPDLLKVEELLQFHDIPFSFEPEVINQTDLILKKLADLGISVPQFPENSLKNIRIQDTRFDYIWNDDNTLVFIMSLIPAPGANKKQSMETARHISRSASARDIISNIYHRRFYVLTTKIVQAERMEQYPKIDKVILVDQLLAKGTVKPLSQLGNASAVMEMLKPFGNRFTVGFTEPDCTVEPETYGIQKRNCSSGLAIILGPNILPTLIAAFSIRGVHELILCYTPGDEIVEQYKVAIRQHKSKLKGFRAVSFFPISLQGYEVLHLTRKGYREINCVISPGTKAQGYFLSLMAAQNQGRIYSINTGTQMLTCLNPGHEDFPLKGPSPSDLFQLKGETLAELGLNQISLPKHSKRFKAILGFIRAVLKTRGISLIDFFDESFLGKKTVTVGNWQYAQKGSQVTLVSDNGTPFTWKLANGEWFEELTGYVLILGGAEHVQIRTRLEWREQIKALVEKSYGTKSFKDDMDVLARVKGRYYLVSCKATVKKQVQKVANEAKAMAHLIDRFCIPMVCFLNFDDDPENFLRCEGVPVFGFNTLIDPHKMTALMETAANDKRTTRQSR